MSVPAVVLSHGGANHKKRHLSKGEHEMDDRPAKQLFTDAAAIQQISLLPGSQVHMTTTQRVQKIQEACSAVMDVYQAVVDVDALLQTAIKASAKLDEKIHILIDTHGPNLGELILHELKLVSENVSRLHGDVKDIEDTSKTLQRLGLWDIEWTVGDRDDADACEGESDGDCDGYGDGDER